MLKPNGLRPCGTQVLIKAIKHETVSPGGIILDTNEVEREQMTEQTGVIVAFGPCCFVGWKGCEEEDIAPYEQWGIRVGDKVEHRKYKGMDSSSNVEGGDVYRYVNDIDILGVIEDE